MNKKHRRDYTQDADDYTSTARLLLFHFLGRPGRRGEGLSGDTLPLWCDLDVRRHLQNSQPQKAVSPAVPHRAISKSFLGSELQVVTSTSFPYPVNDTGPNWNGATNAASSSSPPLQRSIGAFAAFGLTNR
jgi:hypothetical protein